MKHVRLAANWLFTILTFPLFYVALWVLLIGEILKFGFKRIYEEHQGVRAIVFSKEFIDSKRSFLVKGDLWFFQKEPVKPRVRPLNHSVRRKQ